MTYEALRDRALDQCGVTGQSEAETLAEAALEEAMKFVAFNVRIPSLIASATATVPAPGVGSDVNLEDNAIPLGMGGFGITAGAYQAPDRLYIKKDSDATEKGAPYDFLEYHHYLDLKNIPAGNRIGIFTPGTIDERPERPWTITPDNKVWATSITEGNVMTLYYRITPAPYGNGSGSPELLAMFDYILVKGAVLAVKEWLREPEQITTLWDLFESQMTRDVERYDLFLNSQRKRTFFKIHRSYRPVR